MYRGILRVLAAGALLTTFWSVLRVAELTAFDWLASIAIVAALPYRRNETRFAIRSLTLPIVGVVLFAVAGAVSTVSSMDPIENLSKVATLSLDMCLILGFALVVFSKKLLTLMEVLSLLATSGLVGSAVVLLQGQFGLLTSIIPTVSGQLQEWNRFTGLAEHPIETGIASAFAGVICLGIAILSNRWMVWLPSFVLITYSMKYSASLTGVLTFGVATCALFITARRYVLLTYWIATVTVFLGVALSAESTRNLLTQRFDALLQDQDHYETLDIREDQLEQTIKLMDLKTVAVGNGYYSADLPQLYDIHNGLLAALLHFGVLGLASQCILIWSFARKLWGPADRGRRGCLLACICIFAAAYLTGPALQRRSLWVPVFTIGIYLPPPAAFSSRRKSGVAAFKLEPYNSRQTSLT